MGCEHIWFGDDIFALNLHWVKQFADAIEQRDCALPFKIQSRADLMSGKQSRSETGRLRRSLDGR